LIDFIILVNEILFDEVNEQVSDFCFNLSHWMLLHSRLLNRIIFAKVGQIDINELQLEALLYQAEITSR
jgi:hypothetical protein